MQKMLEQKIITSYATAWLEASFSLKKEDKVLNEIDLIIKSLEKDSLLWEKIISPNNDFEKQILTMEALSTKLKLSDVTLNSLKLIAENSRLKYLNLILKEWKKLYYEKMSILEVNVETVIPLSTLQDKKLKKVLETKLKKDVKINYIINETILGGLKVSYDTFLIDDSIETKLKNIENEMLRK